MILDVKKNIFFGILLSLITFLFIFIPGFKVKAANTYTLEDFNDYTTLLTEENIQAYFDYHNIDRSIYDAYFIILEPSYYNGKPNYNQGSGTNYYQVHFYIFNYQDMLDGEIYILTGVVDGQMSYRFVATKGRDYNLYSRTRYLKDFNTEFPNMNTYSDSSNSSVTSKLVGGIDSTTLVEPTVIYTNVDLLYADGSIAFPSSKPKSYTFNEDIDVTNISKVKVKFDLPSDISQLDIDFNYKISFSDGGSGVLGIPYLSSKSVNESGEKKGTTYSSNNFFKNRDDVIESMKNVITSLSDNYFESDINNRNFNTCIENLEKIDKNSQNKENLIRSELKKWYFDKTVEKLYSLALILVNQDYYMDSYLFSIYHASTSTITDFSFVIDTSNYIGTINLNFTSNINYTIEYEYMNDNKKYFVSINMKDYSALIMIPKITGDALSTQSQIYLSGVYDIEYWDNLETKSVLYKKSNFNNSIFYRQLFQKFDNAILYFIKKPVVDPDMDLYIKFDSRYYSYVVKKTLSEEVVINNPNTGEDITIGDISGLYDSNLKNNDFSILDYLDDIKDTADYFDYYFNKGWKLLPFRIRAIILFVFNIMCVAIVLKIGGYKK